MSSVVLGTHDKVHDDLERCIDHHPARSVSDSSNTRVYAFFTLVIAAEGVSRSNGNKAIM